MRLVLLIVIAFLLQGFVSGLLGEGIPPPDLVYLATLLMAASVSPFLGLPLAFSVGLLQDLLSAGYPGLHAVGLLLAAYAYYRLSRLVHWDELAGQVVILGGSFVAKWLGILLVALWLRMGGFNPLTLWSVIVPEMLLTLLIAPLVLRVYQQLFAGHSK
ncbi:rod shape-determining protein MreD [Meiothermus ruber]|jgi:rod shape-determining protein MreD|uniref:Rod shape-determining protein MreD n=1 Tax=Meiothermus ruber (strain ATCC 35948 / DSM 1279 / VKM B-1258 / 21) TaxID=504728 RepID=D3PR43_MEIRD|nr:rod shape-determining protein MreD [Meiothermus ruber]ADD27926.1 rod shape-determining protein MreD [Meiothermus ruber DSM 1279]AGK04395.1 rod shape-determining protein MreD [Meiothermus ruber DSM 1279]MCL6531228.1 rod shape-determining protein MreD [Meiothermus ruber]GAO74864.1 rod shape-determining protein MreD [Meiothermus ruber H328]